MMRHGVLLGCMVLASSAAVAGEHTHWGYAGEGGPENWARLTPEYSTCAGKNQSPIDLTGLIDADLKPIKFAYVPGGKEILNNGHTVQVNYAAGSSITFDGKQFELRQLHFHAPSENLIEGRSYPMEAHLVHADKDGNLAVLAVMFSEGAEHKGLATLWSAMPGEAGEKRPLPAPFAAAELLPASGEYYRFSGSLTTPPCSEGVHWLVMKEPVTVSKSQVEAFAHVMHHPNNRPVQPINSRVVLE